LTAAINDRITIALRMLFNNARQVTLAWAYTPTDQWATRGCATT
jgi:hypothetical protein